jgi:hypothetical protein
MAKKLSNDTRLPGQLRQRIHNDDVTGQPITSSMSRSGIERGARAPSRGSPTVDFADWHIYKKGGNLIRRSHEAFRTVLNSGNADVPAARTHRNQS